MKKLFIILIAVFMAGCVPASTIDKTGTGQMILDSPTLSTPCICPPTDVVVSGDVEGGAVIFAIPKGTFNNPDNFWTLEEFNDELLTYF